MNWRHAVITAARDYLVPSRVICYVMAGYFGIVGLLLSLAFVLGETGRWWNTVGAIAVMFAGARLFLWLRQYAPRRW